MKRKRSKSTDAYAGYLEHPRYGREPRITGLNPSDEIYSEDIFLHWHSREGVRIPNTTIAASRGAAHILKKPDTYLDQVSDLIQLKMHKFCTTFIHFTA